MSRTHDSRKIAIADSQSPLSFGTEGGGNWKEWDRYLLLDGKKAYHMGNICGTCRFFFERLGGANSSANPVQIVADVTTGLVSVTASAVSQIQRIIPDGEYIVTLNEISISLTAPGEPSDYFVKEQVELWGIDPFRGLPHYPKTEYYRADTRTFDGHSCLFEFVIPMFPQGCLNKQRLQEMWRLFNAGNKPTAIALSVLDVKQPAGWTGNPAVTEHWCLAHYLIDGHHKAYAASQCNGPMTLLSFLSLGQGVSSEEQKAKIVEMMKT